MIYGNISQLQTDLTPVTESPVPLVKMENQRVSVTVEISSLYCCFDLVLFLPLNCISKFLLAHNLS